MKHKKFGLGPYPGEVHLYIGPEEDFIKLMKHKYDVEIRLGYLGWCVNLGQVQVIWMHKLDYTVLTHEAFHATDNITARMGLANSGEAAAYLIEYIVGMCLGRIKK